MILTTTRHGRTARDARALGAHLNKQIAQESRVVAIENAPCRDADEALRYMQALRDGSRATTAFHHVTISPRGPLTDAQRDEAVCRVADALGAADHAFILWEHSEKRRAAPGGADRHYHLVLSHVGPSGRALDDSNSYRRLEAVARSLEIDFGERLTHSRRTAAVADELRRSGRDDVADAIISVAPPTPPTSSTSSKKRAAAERQGIDLPAAQESVRNAWAASDNPAAFRAALADTGLTVDAGRKAGVYVVRAGEIEVGALDRIIRQPRRQVTERMAEAPAPAPTPIAEAMPDAPARKPPDASTAGPLINPDAISLDSGTSSTDAGDDNDFITQEGDGYAATAAFLKRWAAQSRRAASTLVPKAPSTGGHHARQQAVASRRDLQRSAGRTAGHQKPASASRAAGSARGPEGRREPPGRDQGTPGVDPLSDPASTSRDCRSNDADRSVARRPDEAIRRVRIWAAVVTLGRIDLRALREEARELARSPAQRLADELELAADAAKRRLDAATAPPPAPRPLERARAVEAKASPVSSRLWQALNEVQHQRDVLRGREPKGMIARLSGQHRVWRSEMAAAERQVAAVEADYRPAGDATAAARRQIRHLEEIYARQRTREVSRRAAEADAARQELARIDAARRILAAEPEFARRYPTSAHLLTEVERRQAEAREGKRRQERQEAVAVTYRGPRMR